MRTAIITLVFSIILAACNKPATDNDYGYEYIDGSGLAGKWVAQERYVSPGGGGTWYALAPEDWFTVEFKDDSTFSYSPEFPKADSLFSRYSVSGPRIFMRSDVSSKTDTWYYNFTDNGRLELGIFLCIEGCAYRLRRIK